MKMVLMGTGTSHGVPVIGCTCKVCYSNNQKDKRLRCSAFVFEPAQIVIDTGPEFRIQALKFGIKTVDAVLLTHAHADHLNGLDDLRIFSHTKSSDCSLDNPKSMETKGKGLCVYTNALAIKHIKTAFDYIFKTVQLGGGKPKLNLQNCKKFAKNNPLKIKSLQILPIPLLHGKQEDTGWLFTEQKDGTNYSIAYLTDCSFISKESINLIKQNCGVLVHLVIDGLRVKPHATHFSFEQALQVAEKLGAKNTWLTHITHDFLYSEIEEYIESILDKTPLLKNIVANGGSVKPAYDGLILQT